MSVKSQRSQNFYNSKDMLFKQKSHFRPQDSTRKRNSFLANKTNKSIYCGSVYGPTFGSGKDIYICDNANTTAGSYSNLGVSYQHPQPEQGESYLAGSDAFLLSEIEVYRKE